jgi:DNA-binding protein H-NS
MKFSLVLLSAMAATSSAFVAQQPVAFRSVTQLQGTKAAASKEEDIEMTRKLILDFKGMESSEAAPEELPSKEEAAPAKKEE